MISRLMKIVAIKCSSIPEGVCLTRLFWWICLQQW